MPKKIKNIFDEHVDYEIIYNAYILSKKGKSFRKDVVLFSLRFENYIKKIVLELKNEKYTFSGYRLFYVYEPKCRKILAASFKDRIIHTWYVKSFIEPAFTPQFINNSYACIKAKGMHLCALDVKKCIYNLSRKPEFENAYILKMDIAKFFQNIDREILYGLIEKKISDVKVLNLTKKILYLPPEFEDKIGVGIPIRKSFVTNICKYIYERSRSICKTCSKM